MRIIQVVRSGAFAGVERYLTYLAPELARRGHDVSVIGGEPARMQAALEPAGVTFVPAVATTDVTRALWELGSPDLLHTHMTAAEAATIVARLRVRAPIVTTLHFAQPRGGGGAKAAAYRVLRPFFAREVAISHFVAAAAGGDPLVIHNGVPDGPAAAEHRERVVLVGQRFEREKDTATALLAWARSGLATAGWELHLAGAGAERDDLEILSRELGIASSVRFLGQVDDLRGRMARASLFLATAPAEPFGLSVTEAMAASVAILAADGGAHPEVLGPDAHGQLFAPGDADACAAGLRLMCGDEPRRQAAGRANRSRYESAFSVDRHVDQIEALYREVRAPRARV